MFPSITLLNCDISLTIYKHNKKLLENKVMNQLKLNLGNF